MYRCKACGSEVIFLGGTPVRDCLCDPDTAVTADVSATVSGHGGILVAPKDESTAVDD